MQTPGDILARVPGKVGVSIRSSLEIDIKSGDRRI